MAFRRQDLTVLAYANDFTLWHYRVQPGEDITDTGYFDLAAGMMREGDEIKASLPGPKVREFIVTKIKNLAVTIKEKGKEHQFSSGDNPQKKKEKAPAE